MGENKEELKNNANVEKEQAKENNMEKVDEIIELKKTIAVGKEIVKQENRGCFECPLLKAAPVFVQYRFCRKSFLVCCREIISLGDKMEEIAGYRGAQREYRGLFHFFSAYLCII